MAKEVINQIADAELKGKAQRRQAHEDAAKILQSIKPDSEKLISEKIAKSKAAIDKIYESADIKVKEILNKAQLDSEKSTSSLKEIIKKNEDNVVKSVINLLV